MKNITKKKYFPLVRDLVYMFIIISLFSQYISFYYLILGYSLVWFLHFLYVEIRKKQLQKRMAANGVVFGARGSGKSWIVSSAFSKKKHVSNVKMNDNTEVIDIKDYINVLSPNTVIDMIDNTIKKVKYPNRYYRVPVIIDDIAAYAPNYIDKLLKERYKGMGLLLPISRHVLENYLVMITQDLERPYILLRELQRDYFIKVIETKRKHWLWSYFIFRGQYVRIEYIYYESYNSALLGLMPFNSKALINKTISHAHLGAGYATKKQYEITNGKIIHTRAFVYRNIKGYDTHYFRDLLTY